MVKLFGLPFIAAGLMATAWISTLGGSLLMFISGLAIGVLTFLIVLQAQQKARHEAV